MGTSIAKKPYIFLFFMGVPPLWIIRPCRLLNWYCKQCEPRSVFIVLCFHERIFSKVQFTKQGRRQRSGIHTIQVPCTHNPGYHIWESDKNIRKHHIQESQEVSPDHKAARNDRQTQLRLFDWDMSCDMRFPTMWYVRPAKAQTSLCICAVWSEPLLVAWIFYEY